MHFTVVARSISLSFNVLERARSKWKFLKFSYFIYQFYACWILFYKQFLIALAQLCSVQGSSVPFRSFLHFLLAFFSISFTLYYTFKISWFNLKASFEIYANNMFRLSEYRAKYICISIRCYSTFTLLVLNTTHQVKTWQRLEFWVSTTK